MQDTVSALNQSSTSTLKHYVQANAWLQPHAAYFKQLATKRAQQGAIWRERDDNVEGAGGAPFVYWTKDLDAIANTIREHAAKVARQKELEKLAPEQLMACTGLRPESVSELRAQQQEAMRPQQQETAPTPAQRKHFEGTEKLVRYACMALDGKLAVVQVQKKRLYLIARFENEQTAREYAEWKNAREIIKQM